MSKGGGESHPFLNASKIQIKVPESYTGGRVGYAGGGPRCHERQGENGAGKGSSRSSRILRGQGLRDVLDV